jgi:hypothetical protein
MMPPMNLTVGLNIRAHLQKLLGTTDSCLQLMLLARRKGKKWVAVE